MGMQLKVGRRKIWIIALCFLFSYFSVYTQEVADTVKLVIQSQKDFIQLRNGSRLVGKILEVSLGELQFDPDDIDNVKIKLRDIAWLIAQSASFKIQLLNGTIYYGQLLKGDKLGYTLVQSTSAQYQIDIKDIWQMIFLERSFFKGLSGNIALGYSYTKSSAVSRFNFSNNLTFPTRKWIYDQSSDGIYTLGGAGEGFEQADAALTASWQFKSRWANIYRVQYQRQVETGISARYSVVFGIGKLLVQSYHVKLSVASGLSIQKEFPTDNSATPNLQVEIPGLLSFNLFQLKHPDIDIITGANFYYSLSQPGRFRIDYNANFNYEIIKDFIISFQFYFNFDSQPPAVNTSNNDYGTVFSIGYKFY